jgi:Flp pilus assembly protein TadD
MRKAIATTILFFFSACALMVVFSACALFQDSHRSTYVLTGSDAERFIGSIRARHSAAESHYELGCYMQERQKHKPAIEEFKVAVQMDPSHVKAYNAMGVSYDALGEHSRAVASYEAALRVYPKLDYVLNNLGYSYLLQGKADLAVEHFKAAVELDGANARYRNNLGLAYAKSGRYDVALAEFKESGDEATAHYNIAQLYYREGLYEEAKSHFEEAALLKASDPEIERGLMAASTLTEILVNSNEQGSSAPTDEKVPPSTLRGNVFTVKSEKAAEAPRQTSMVRVETRQLGPDESGFFTIPAEALSTYTKVEVVEQRVDEVPVYRAALARVDYGQERREVLDRKMEEDLFARLTEAQTLELASLQATEDRVAPRIKIEVSNGNGIRRMARNVGYFLSGRNVILMYLSNARHFNYDETRIYYTPGYLMEAYELAQKLPGRQTLEEVPEVRDGNAEISVLIGKDLVPHLNLFRKG